MYHRIVSLAPSITETIFALNAQTNLVGITDYCNYPPETSTIARVDGFATPSIEKILDLNPDLILATSLHKADKLAVFRANGIEVKQLSAVSLFDAPELIRSVGNLIGNDHEANLLATQLHAAMQLVLTKGKEISAKQKVCYLCTSAPFCSFKAKCPTNQLVELLGGQLCGNDGFNLALSILNDDPDVLIIPYIQGSKDYQTQQAFVDSHPELKQLRVFKRNNVKVINGELLSRPGPRAAEGLSLLFNVIHN